MFQNLFAKDKWVNAGNGCINVERDLDESSIRQILKEKNLFQVQFHKKPSHKTWDLLNNKLFSIRPDVFLRLTNYSEPLTDLSFLRAMDNLQRLYLDIFDLSDLSSIGELTNLTGLILSETKSKNYTLAPISKLHRLNYLTISGLKKDIDTLSTLKKLNELTLRSVTLDSVEFLTNFEKLERLHVILGGTKNYEALTDLPELRYLELWQVRQLADIEFISDLKTLEFLSLSSLRNVTALPKFTNTQNLVKLMLETLKGLRDVSNLKNLSLLEEFLFVAANNLTPEQFTVLKDCKNLKMASVGFGSLSKNSVFDQMMSSFGIAKYDWRKSKHKHYV